MKKKKKSIKKYINILKVKKRLPEEAILNEPFAIQDFEQALEPLRSIFKNIDVDVLRDVIGFGNALHKKHQTDMSFMPPFLDNVPVSMISEAFLDSKKSPIKIYQLLLQDPKVVKSLSKQWKKDSVLASRIKILEDALQAHLEKKYTLSIPVLLTQLEGIISDKFQIKHKQIQHAVKEGFADLPRSPEVDFADGAYQFINIITSEVFNSNEHVDHKSRNIYANRHKILHGNSLNYHKNPQHSVRLIMLIDFMRSEEMREAIVRFSAKKQKIRNKIASKF